MIRRAILVGAAAAALILAPSAAMAAYDAPGFSSSVSDSTPAIGQRVIVTINGGTANAGQMIRLVITSNGRTIMTLNEKASSSGSAKFNVKLSTAGTFKAEAFNAAGKSLSTQVLTVTGSGSGSGASVGSSVAGSGSAAGGNLSNTGFDSMGLALGGGALVVAGSGAVVVARRRRSTQPA